MIAINMPVIGQDIPTGVIVEWFKKAGDRVEKDEVIAVVESEKAAFDVESSDAGTLLKLLYQEGDEVEILTPIAYLGSEGEVFQDPNKGPEPSTGNEDQPAPLVNVPLTVSDKPKENGKVVASPLARKVAKENGIPLSELRGTGPGGRIIKKNVLSHLELNKPATAADKLKPEPAGVALQDGPLRPLSNLKRIAAERLSYSKQNIPHFYLSIDVEMDKALQWRKKINERPSVKVSINDLITYACSRSLKEFSLVNATFTENGIAYNRNVNIGIASDTERGLLVPVVEDAANLDILEISRSTQKIVENARKGKLDLSTKGTFTISSLGMFGIREFLPIINPPEAAILAVGKVEETIKVQNGQFGICNMVRLNIACDHRIVDGAYGAKFLNAVKQYLEEADFKIFV